MLLIISVGFCAFWYLYLLQSSFPRAEDADFAGNPEWSSNITGYLARLTFRKKPGYNFWHTAHCKVCPPEGRVLIAGRGKKFPSSPQRFNLALRIIPTSYFMGFRGPFPCTVGQINRNLAEIQILRLPWNDKKKSSWGAKESSQENENVLLMIFGSICSRYGQTNRAFP